MSQAFASGKEAWGVCDICGWRYLLLELRAMTDNGKSTGIKACPECWNPEHPQDDIDKLDTSDPQSLMDPRPERDLAGQRSAFGWNPVGNPLNAMIISINSVTITTT